MRGLSGHSRELEWLGRSTLRLRLNQEEIGDESSELSKKSPVAGISIKMTPAMKGGKNKVCSKQEEP